MKKTVYMIAVPALVLLCAMLWLLIAGEQDAAALRREVVRFHVVAASDSPADQRLKCRVRDGLFEMIERLFADCNGQGQALETAQAHRNALEERAQSILRENGSNASVTVEVGERYFPTKTYGGLAFPAGRYQAVSIRIGEAAGQNFWCVLYPALCIAPAVAEDSAADEMTAVLGENGTDFLKKSSQTHRIKFALVEWFEVFMEKYIKS